ncbi:FadR family transcriptional regulator [Chitinophaga agrisoli]|uniref:FadR family transcriptional regulator n=1 Tax=Chitinophaga agrisoli TaxID=2607653 RepID=A0A5B2W4P6_9BACT|nr:FadR/GntR family transcriptional regulator [Chitinophaga agrisoli]KAA2245397.1 FadR family transcriptional regulator [Chitinophaga agrisoli]
MNNTTPIKRLSLTDEVAQRIQQQISLGQYQPGDKLPTEPALMQEFGVGRSSIREAVRILANAGVLRVQQGVGTFVEAPNGAEPLSQRLRRADFSDLDEVRQLLEQKIAEKAALYRTDADIEKMRECLQTRDELSAANDIMGCIKADIAFHTAVAAAAKNSIMADLHTTVAQHMLQHFMVTHTTTKPFVDTQQWHWQLLQSIIDQKPEEVQELVSLIVGYRVQAQSNH